MRNLASLVACGCLAVFAGCGYSTHSALPAAWRTIYIDPFVNKISLTSETSQLAWFQTSLPRLEEDVTSGVINRFIFDGHLHVTPNRQGANLILTGEVTNFYRQALRVADNGQVEEYRLNLVGHVTLREAESGTLVWEEPDITRDTTYFLNGNQTQAEAAVITPLITDFARRVVERTIENW